MPINQSVGSFNTGIDCRVVLIGPFGRVDIPNVTMFDVKQSTSPVRSDRLDGVQMNAELPKGWTYTIESDRGSSALDDLFEQTEAQWYNAGTIGNVTVYQYVNETDGSTSTYQLDNASMKLDDPGTWKGDTITKQRISGSCNRRRRV